MIVPPRTLTTATATALGLILVAGCDQPTGSTRPRSSTNAPVVAADPAPEPAQPDPNKPREILGKRTQDIRDIEAEKKSGGVVTQPRITAKDPITIQGNAYVSIVGQAAILNIQHALDLYKAETGEFPKTTEEFMEKIIKANNIALPKLPFYQEYGYDAPNHKLVILEYPDRKEKANYPQ